jgi:Mg-chelatase subunit ChlD
MRLLFIFLLVIIGSANLNAQHWSISPERVLDFGKIERAGIIQTFAVIKNLGTKPLVLLKANAPKGFTISTSKKVIPPGDTVHLNIAIRPLNAGKINEKIEIFTNLSESTTDLRITGEIQKLQSAELANCVRFDPKSGASGGASIIPLFTDHTCRFVDSASGETIKEASILYVSQLNQQKTEHTTLNGLLQSSVPIGPYVLLITAPGYESKTISQYIAYNQEEQVFKLNALPVKLKSEEIAEIPPKFDSIITRPIEPNIVDTDELSEAIYKPNNIVILIDVSGSMKESDKLPLLKKSIASLMGPIRAIDKVTIITYATEVKVVVPTVDGNQKKQVLTVVDTLKADGVTAGSKGIQVAYDHAHMGFIAGGNNQVILATDGIFRISGKDRKMIIDAANSNNKKIKLSVLGFGDDEQALSMLEEFTKIGSGNMIVVSKKSQAERAIIEEIKTMSKK